MELRRFFLPLVIDSYSDIMKQLVIIKHGIIRFRLMVVEVYFVLVPVAYIIANVTIGMVRIGAAH